MWWSIALVATAVAAPEVRVQDDGTVVGIARIDAPPDAVRSIVGSATTLAELSPEVLEIKVEAEGACERVERRTRGLLRPLRLFSRRCPTEAGWREELVDEGDFSAYASEWIVEPDDAGTRVEVRVSTELRLAVPGSVVRAGVVSSTTTMLENLVGRVTGVPGG